MYPCSLIPRPFLKKGPVDKASTPGTSMYTHVGHCPSPVCRSMCDGSHHRCSEHCGTCKWYIMAM